MNDRSLTITTAAASDPAYSNQNFVNNNDSIISGERHGLRSTNHTSSSSSSCCDIVRTDTVGCRQHDLPEHHQPSDIARKKTTVKNWRRKFNVRRSGGTSADAIDDTVVGTFRRTSGDIIASSTVYPIQNQVPVLLANNQLIATVSNPTITTTQTMTDRPTSSSVTRSTGRSNRNSPFCPCFSPTDSDLDDDTPIPLAIVNVETAGNIRVNRVGIDQRTTSPCRQIMHMAREIRSRLVVAAETTQTNQINVGPSTVRRLASNMLIDQPYPVHTTVEYTHYLVPDMLQVTHAPYYWGVMDRYEAERLLEGKPEGTFLLRDSAQNEYLFSVSFRRYQRTLHARIEEMNHRFSFDSYDPAVFSAATVTELIDNYKDPSRCLFFEPQLTHALHRTFVFPLQHLCRSVIASRLEYNDLAKLNVPRKLNEYLREYHYKQAVRVTSYEPCSSVGTT